MSELCSSVTIHQAFFNISFSRYVVSIGLFHHRFCLCYRYSPGLVYKSLVARSIEEMSKPEWYVHKRKALSAGSFHTLIQDLD